MKIQHFFQISSNLQNIFESSSETCMWNLSQFRKVDLFHWKMPTVPLIKLAPTYCRTYWNHHQKHACEIWAHSEKWTYFIEKCRQCRPFEISWNFNIFSKFTKFHQTCRTYWNHIRNIWNLSQSSSEKCMWHFSQRSYKLFSQKNADSAGPRNIMKFQHFFKVHQISSNLQNIFESSSETCLWNLSQFRNIMKNSTFFSNFSKFTKFHQTCRTYWNHHQKHACEIWANSEKLTYFTEKCWQCRPFEISWNFNIFSKFTKFHQTCRTYLNGSSSETCMWNLSHFREVDLFHRKMPVPALWQCRPCMKYHEISTFFQSSPNFIKLAEFIGIIIRNIHVKFEPIQRSYIFSQKNADSAGPRNIMKISTFIQCSQNFIKLAEHIGIIIRNMHVKFEPIQRS